MTFSAQVFRILIASPSDVNEEREIAVRAIQEWNDLNSAERQLVLLPLRWETHSAPEYGRRPQEVINRQVVDYCDLVIGIFWTRVGSPTGAADSGTIEEIERVAMKGRKVMLYFSQAKQDPENIDIDQLTKLREFKKKTFPKALVENYAGPIEFKDKLSKQIEIQLRSILAERAEGEFSIESIRPITDIVFHFADVETGQDIGTEMHLETTFLDVSKFDQVPDYAAPKVEKIAGLGAGKKNTLAELAAGINFTDANKDYYRQRVTSLVLKEFFRPLRFWLKNRGGVGARDVYIDFSVHSDKGGIVLITRSQLPAGSPSIVGSGFGLLSDRHPNTPDELIAKSGDSWRSQIEVQALQPQRELSPNAEFFIGAKESCTVVITARIYADTLPEPEIQELKLNIDVKNLALPANQVVDELIRPSMPMDDRHQNS